MSVLTLWAGSPLTKLPSPTSLKGSSEQIWSKDTGRAQSGDNKAKMVGDSLASKHTYAIEWGILTATEYNTITSNLTRGFFPFGIGSPTEPPANPANYYRSEIQYELIQVGTARYYKGVNVSVIEQ